jgi:class 3 adenylate cyclase
MHEEQVELEAKQHVTRILFEVLAPARFALRKLEPSFGQQPEAVMEQVAGLLRQNGVPGELVARIRSKGESRLIYPPEGHPTRSGISPSMFSTYGLGTHGNRIYVSMSSLYLDNAAARLGLAKGEVLQWGLLFSLKEFEGALPRLGYLPAQITFFDAGKAVARARWDIVRGERSSVKGVFVDVGGDLPDSVLLERLQSEKKPLMEQIFGYSALWDKDSRIRVEDREGKQVQVWYDVARFKEAGTGWSGSAVATDYYGPGSWFKNYVAPDMAEIAISLLGFILLLVAIIIFPVVSNRITQPVLAVRDALRSIAAGDYSVRVKETRKDEIGQLQKLVNHAAQELQRREAMKDLFGKYLSKQVADKILESGSTQATGGLRKEVSILFADVRGFTSYSERHDPEDVTKSLNEYFEVMVDVITVHDGVLDKYIGDGLMVVFGAPMAQPDHARRAVITALEMQAALQSLNLRRAQRGDDPINIGIGVNTGLAISGNLGSIKRMEFTVIGDTVNLAARLESRAQIGQILIGAGTYNKVRDVVEAEALGPLTVKGKTEAVDVWALKGLKVGKTA